MGEDQLGRNRRGPLAPLGKMVADSVGDLGAAVSFLRVLPEIATSLKAIQGHVETLDNEVAGMHASVERIEVEIGDLKSRISTLEQRMNAVGDAVTRLEPHVADVNLAIRPFRRARARFRPADGNAAEGDGPAPDWAPADESAEAR